MNKSSYNITICANAAWNIINFRKNFINFLQKKNLNLNILTSINKQDFDNLDFVPKKNLFNVAISRKFFSPFTDMLFLFQIFFYFYKNKTDLIISYTLKANLFCLFYSKIFKKKIILNITGLGTTVLTGSILRKVVFFFYKLLRHNNAFYIFQNQFDMNLFIENDLIIKNNSTVIMGSGVNVNYFYKYISKPISKKIKFLFVGRIIKQKGFIELIHAFLELKKKHIDINLHVVGKIDNNNISKINQSYLDSLINKKIINYFGFDNDVRSHMENADCLVLPSYREGTSKVILEACSMELPIITTDVPGCNNIIINEYNGFLCKPKDYKDLLKVMNKFINTTDEEKSIMSKNARKFVINNFSDEVVFEKYIKYINNVLKVK